MRILLTGNNGYIGTVLASELLKKNYEVVGYDVDYFNDCNLDIIDTKYIKHISKDIRNVSYDDLNEIDIVIHLAGLANLQKTKSKKIYLCFITKYVWNF